MPETASHRVGQNKGFTNFQKLQNLQNEKREELALGS